jgi:hypothetical protein
VNRNKLWSIIIKRDFPRHLVRAAQRLIKRDFPRHLVRAAQRLYHETQIVIKREREKDDKKISMNQEVRQG